MGLLTAGAELACAVWVTVVVGAAACVPAEHAVKRSAVLVLRGESGIGKTALLGYAECNAGDMTVLRCAGVKAEHEFPFAGLHQLLRSCLGLLYRLAAPQQAALRSAFGMSFDPVLSPYLVSLGVLSLLAEACDDAPVLCLIDDAHWLDRPSQEALAFAGRRLEAEPVAILMASRQRSGQRFEAAGLPELEFGGLDDGSARALLHSRLKRPAADEIVTMLVRAARGNPLALLELPVSLTDRQLDGTDPIAGPLRAKGAVEESFRARVGLLSDGARRALLLAAADEGGDLPTPESALKQYGLPGTAFQDAEDAGLVQQIHGTVVFRHPLVRSAAYRCATRSEHFEQVDPTAFPPSSILATPGIIDAALRLGQLARAHAALSRFAAWAPVSRTPLVNGMLARCRGVLATDRQQADTLFAEALRHHDHRVPPFERARTQLAYGERLRRDRLKTDARIQLRSALDTFDAIGTRLWAERARDELRATGETVRKRDDTMLETLTPQERRVARLVAEGASNKDVAAQLFLSSRTVEYHLGKVFTKLGVASRVELARLPLESALAGQSA